jgi:hypothetical protein
MSNTNLNLNKFNSTFHTFLKELWDKYGREHGVCDEYFMQYYGEFLEMPDKFNEDTGFLLDYLELVEPQLHLLKDENLDIFKSRVIDHVFFNNEELKLDVTSIYDIMRYYKVLFIYAFRHTYKGDIMSLMHSSLLSENSEQNALITPLESAFLDIVKSLKHGRTNRIEEQLKAKEEDKENGGGEGGDGDFNMTDIKKQMNSIMPGMGRMLDNELGQTAMNIMQDINLEDIDLGDPMKLVQSMMSGNAQNHSGISSLVSTITSKIHQHVEEGKIDTELLKRQAVNMKENNDEGLKNMMNTMENNGEFMQDMMGKMMNFMGGKLDPEKMKDMMENMSDDERRQFLESQFADSEGNANLENEENTPQKSADDAGPDEGAAEMTEEQVQQFADMQKQWTAGLANMLGGAGNGGGDGENGNGQLNPFSMLSNLLGQNSQPQQPQHPQQPQEEVAETTEPEHVETPAETIDLPVRAEKTLDEKKALLMRLKHLRGLKKAQRTRK